MKNDLPKIDSLDGLSAFLGANIRAAIMQGAGSVKAQELTTKKAKAKIIHHVRQNCHVIIVPDLVDIVIQEALDEAEKRLRRPKGHSSRSQRRQTFVHKDSRVASVLR